MNDDWTDFEESFETQRKIFLIFFGIVFIIILCIVGFIIFSVCFRLCNGQSLQDYRRQRNFPTGIPPPPPVVVTTTTIPVPSGYPAQNTVVQGYPMPHPQPGYPHAQAEIYPNQPMPQPYAMPQPQVDYNPPSYDQVVRGGEVYQKQAPYNPNYTGQ